MSTEKRAFNRLFGKKKKEELSKEHKVALSLVDSFNYDYTSLEDETGRLSYSVEEWYDEKFQEFYEARSVLRDVYINNSESFITVGDVSGDKEILEEIRAKAEELGLEADDVYPDWQLHFDAREYLDYLEGKFDDQVGELNSLGL